MTPRPQCIEVWGDLACFTRPELKVERFSYPVITPSAARAVFDAIYLNRHKFRWQVTQIEILEPPRYIALRRNEVKEKAPSASTIATWIEGKADPQPIWADADKDFTGSADKGRTQRQTMALKGVRYRITAEIHPWPGNESELPCFEGQFRRRAAAGQCIYQPYLGCREFPGFFRLGDPLSADPVPLDMEIGWMLYDVFDLSRPGSSVDAPLISLFRAAIRAGFLVSAEASIGDNCIPEFTSSLVRRPERRGTDA